MMNVHPVEIGVRTYRVDFDREQVFVEVRRWDRAPRRRLIPWTGPRAMEARLLARTGSRAEAWRNPAA